MSAVEIEFAKHFTNIHEVLDKMLEMGFFSNRVHRDEVFEQIIIQDKASHYDNGVVKVTISTPANSPSFVLNNPRVAVHSQITELFDTARMVY